MESNLLKDEENTKDQPLEERINDDHMVMVNKFLELANLGTDKYSTYRGYFISSVIIDAAAIFSVHTIRQLKEENIDDNDIAVLTQIYRERLLKMADILTDENIEKMKNE